MGNGTLGGSFIGFWGARMIETKRQSFQREQDAKDDRARALHATRILDLALMEAEALLGTVERNHRLWPDTIKVPADTDWLELRAVVAPILDPEPWWAVHLGFLAVTHLRDFEAGCRKLAPKTAVPTGSPAAREIARGHRPTAASQHARARVSPRQDQRGAWSASRAAGTRSHGLISREDETAAIKRRNRTWRCPEARLGRNRSRRGRRK